MSSPQEQILQALAPVAEEECDGLGRRCSLLAVLHALPVGVSIKEADTLRYLYRNRASEIMLGVSHAASVGRRAVEIFPPEVGARFEASDREALAHGSVKLPDLPLPGGPSGERLISASKTVLRDRQDRPRLIVCVFEEITERRRLEESLRQANVQLEHRVRSRGEELERTGRIHQLGEMAAGLAHEINQPLAAITYTLTGAVKRARAGHLNNAQMADILQGAIEHAYRCADILRRVRDMATPHTPRREALHLVTLIGEVLDLCRPAAREARVRLEATLEPQLPPIEGDRVQLEQVLLNLVRNGIEAVAEADGRWRQVSVSAARRDAAALELRVEDSGAGCEPDVLRRVFEPFFTTKEGGMGLGLAICQRIIEDHGGKLWATPRPEGGLCFALTLPLAGGAGLAADES